MQSDSKQPLPAKGQCPDCKMCQNCSEVRCLACRSGKACARKRKLSIQEQIALFDSLNAPHAPTLHCCTSHDPDREALE
jgi:hypothetical protein